MNGTPPPQQPSPAEQQIQSLLKQVRKTAPEQPHGQLLLMLCECIQRLDNLERLVRGAFQALSEPTPHITPPPSPMQCLPPPPVRTIEDARQQQLNCPPPPMRTIEAAPEVAASQPQQPQFPRIHSPPPQGPADVQPLMAE